MQMHPVTAVMAPNPPCATLPPVDHRAEGAAGAGSHRAAERGGGPFELGLGARTAYLSVAPTDLCNANNAFVHSYVAAVSRHGGRSYDARPVERDAAVADGRVARAIAALDQYLGEPGASGITTATVTASGCANPPCHQR